MSRSDWEAEQQPTVIWPENLQAFELWQTVGDQWRMGMGGPVALDQMPVRHELDRRGLEKQEYEDLFDDIRVMAAAVLEHLAAE